MKKFSLGMLVPLVVIGFSGCTTRLGNMTVASTNNIDGLKTHINAKQRVQGESCTEIIIVIPVGNLHNKLQASIDNAIDNGHKAGLEGDTLVNVKIDRSWWWIPYIYGKDCTHVKGDLIPLSKSMK